MCRSQSLVVCTGSSALNGGVWMSTNMDTSSVILLWSSEGDTRPTIRHVTGEKMAKVIGRVRKAIAERKKPLHVWCISIAVRMKIFPRRRKYKTVMELNSFYRSNQGVQKVCFVNRSIFFRYPQEKNCVFQGIEGFLSYSYWLAFWKNMRLIVFLRTSYC